MISPLLSLLGEPADICVIGGAGPVGLALAISLAKAGLHVIVLESGGRRVCEKTNGLSAASSISTKHHADPRLMTRRAIGGTSKAWGGRCVGFDDSDFDGRQVRGDARWPDRPQRDRLLLRPRPRLPRRRPSGARQAQCARGIRAVDRDLGTADRYFQAAPGRDQTPGFCSPRKKARRRFSAARMARSGATTWDIW